MIQKQQMRSSLSSHINLVLLFQNRWALLLQFLLIAALIFKYSQVMGMKFMIKGLMFINSCSWTLKFFIRYYFNWIQLIRLVGSATNINFTIYIILKGDPSIASQFIWYPFPQKYFVASQGSTLYLSSFLGKGYRQNIIQYKMIPNDQMSAEVLVFLPWQLRKIQGARQLKVPKILFSQPDSLEMFEICEHPKSQILQQVPYSLAQRMFQGLRSRCMILQFQSSRKAQVIWMTKVSNFSSSKTVLSSICFLNDPLHKSIIMLKKNQSSSQWDQMILMTLSLWISSNLLTSTLASSRYGFWTQICLTAQCSLFQLLTISCTEAKVPQPNFPKSVYFLSWIQLNIDLLILVLSKKYNPSQCARLSFLKLLSLFHIKANCCYLVVLCCTLQRFDFTQLFGENQLALIELCG